MNEFGGSTQRAPLQSAGSLHVEPTVPFEHVRDPSELVATHAPVVQSPSSTHLEPLAPVVHSPDPAPATIAHRPPEQSASCWQGV
jgi:hypothetical protein